MLCVVWAESTEVFPLTNHVSQAVAEEIHWFYWFNLTLDSFVAAFAIRDTQALSNLETLFDNGKSMSRFATDLLDISVIF